MKIIGIQKLPIQMLCQQLCNGSFAAAANAPDNDYQLLIPVGFVLPFFIIALIAVGAKVISLGLNQVGGQRVGNGGVEIGECAAQRWG